MSNYECYLAAIADGWQRLHGAGHCVYERGGVYALDVRVDPAPEGRGPDYYEWANRPGVWELRVLTAEEAAPVVERVRAGQAASAAIQRTLDAEMAAWRAAHPAIPMDRGGLAALIAADRPS